MVRIFLTALGIGALVLFALPADGQSDPGRDGPFYQDPGDGCLGPEDPFCNDQHGDDPWWSTSCDSGSYNYGGCQECHSYISNGDYCVECRTPLYAGDYRAYCQVSNGSCTTYGAYCGIYST